MPSAPDPLPNNGVIQVHFDGKTTDYALQTIHYRLDLSTGVAICTLNEPQRLNALTTAQQWEYMLLLNHAQADDRVKVLVWTGHGRAFSSGADLSGKAPEPKIPADMQKWFAKNKGFKDPDVFDGALKSLTLAFWDFDKPSVVAVNGLAIGGAANIALANYHDIVLASTAAYFKYPFPDLGLTPELGSSFLMPVVAGMTRTKRMMLIGERISPFEAKEMGLVLEVTSPENLMPKALEYAGKLAAKKNQKALRMNKAVINSHFRQQLEAVMDRENASIEVAMNDMLEEMMKAAQARKAARAAKPKL